MKGALKLGLVAGLVLVLPLAVQSDTALTIVIFSFLLGMLAVSFNLIFGFTGQLSMFHAAAFGIGAYATHLAMAFWNVSFWEGMALAAVLVGALSVVVGAICFRFRLREFYFAVVTLAFSEVARLVVLNWNSVTNGTLGINLQVKPTLWLPGQGLVKIDGTLMWYYVSAVALAVTVLVAWRLVHSWMGRCFAAIRLNDELGDVLGINVFRYKLAVFVIANVIAACTGGLYVFYLGFIEPGFLSIDQSLAIVAMVLLGGRGAVAAPIIGAFVLTALPHLIHFGAEVRSIVYGAILILTILLMPQGFYGTLSGLLHRSVPLRENNAA
jgi:branched-chain amino acid transport system permease protein